MAATLCEEKGSRSLSWSRMVCRVDLKREVLLPVSRYRAWSSAWEAYDQMGV